jgi:ATP-dependent DNA helicase RecQ
MDGYNEEQYLKILHDNWGYPDFRGIQRDIIRSVADGNDTLGLMPTGGGKSLTFQVPALAKEGTCIVITPLIALMKDQVDNLRRRGIIAAAIYTGKTQREIVATLDNCILGRTKLLYISPERIASELFQTKLKHMKVSLITVDEAHCISQWGYDFRPSYLNIAEIRNIKPDVPILALTATATERVTVDIQERLGFKKSNMFKMIFCYSSSSAGLMSSICSCTMLRLKILSSMVYAMSKLRFDLMYRAEALCPKAMPFTTLLDFESTSSSLMCSCSRPTTLLVP